MKTKGTTILPLGHDGVTQGQRREELGANGTLPASELLHQARCRHEQTAARVGIPAQVHGLQIINASTFRRHSKLTLWIQK